MKRFGLTMAAVGTLLLLLCGGAIVVGRLQPPSKIIPGLNACGGELLCYQNIVLDKTTLNDASAILAQLPETAPNAGAGSILLSSGPIQKILLSVSSDTGNQADINYIREVDLYLRDNATSIAGIVAGLGAPCGVYPVQPRPRDPLMIQIVYPQMDFWVQTRNWSLEPGMPASQIDIGPTVQTDYSGVRATINRCLTNPDAFYEWRGFSRYPLK